MRCRIASAIMAAAVSCFPANAWAQMPAGGEFQVNTYTTGNQFYPSIASDARGSFVVVWDGRTDFFVKGQRFDPAGARVGAEFTVNTAFSYYPAVAMRRSGEFVVVWSQYSDGDSGGIKAQRFDATANKLGAEFFVNAYTTSRQIFPNAALDAQGNFVVSWWSYALDGSLWAVAARRFDTQGNPRGEEFVVNTYTTGSQYVSDISSDAGGNFVIGWSSLTGSDGSGQSANAQRYDSSGVPQGGEFVVNSYTTGNQLSVGLAHAPDGSLVVGFMSNQTDAAGDVIAKRYDASGNSIGAEFVVNTSTSGRQGYPDVAMDAQGNFVVSWWDSVNDGSGYSVFARRFLADGTPRGGNFQVNTYTTGWQVPNRLASTIASDEVGNFVVTWWSPQFPGAGQDNFAQRYGGLHPSALQADPTGNGVIEPGETAELRPSWSNFNGATQAFGGVLSNLTGPPGPTYTITDASGNYGSVPNGASAPCTDCYGVSASGTRPALHWDASVLESLAPDTQGQQKTWSLHIGDSFSDVPSSSPFYRFVETLLHRGVTGGCSPTDYCPVSTATREQMAVFTLVAKDGQGAAPPACAPPNLFTDVPETSPYCRFIEELANRGVVSGCGGGNYCPTSPVSREQMAVFVLRTLDPALNPPACAPPNLFTDVPETSPFCSWIEELANRGVVSGCGGGNYCPTDPVTREQMAVFISVGFGLGLYGP